MSFFVTARLLSAASETRNKHISKSLYQFFGLEGFSLARGYLVNPQMLSDSLKLRGEVSAVNNEQAQFAAWMLPEWARRVL
jgi:hypothetical protein